MLEINKPIQLIGCLVFFIVIGTAGNTESGNVNEDMSSISFARPKINYQCNDRRDPFVQPKVNQYHHVIGQVDIESLKLTGIIRNPSQATALFTNQTGPRFGYLLKDGKLYRENHQPVTEITGEIVNPKEVILRQDDRKIVFKLR